MKEDRDDEVAEGQETEGEAPALDDSLDDTEVQAPQGPEEALKERLLEREATVMRLMADFENLRRRTAERELGLREEVLSDVMERLLPVADNLERAIAADGPGVKEGVAMTLESFRQTLSALGLEEVKAKGMPFDPHLHEALQEEPSASPEGTILEVFRPGYRLGGRLIRPALVKVAKALSDES